MVISILENKYYTIEYLQDIFGCSYEEILTFSERKQIVQWHDSNRKLAFHFVGFLFHSNATIAFLPKYLKNTEEINLNEYTALLLRVIHKYQRNLLDTDYDSEILEEIDDMGFHLLGTISYLLQHYCDYGFYVKEHDVQDPLYEGEIDWNTTIDENIGYLTDDNKPVYLDLIKTYADVDLNAKITDIHKFVLNECSKIVSTLQLDLIFSWPQLLFDIKFNWDNNYDEAIYIIEKEMLTEFQDQKLHLLKNLKLFLEQMNSMNFSQDPFIVGTKYFYHIWEKCCSDVLGHDSSIQHYISKPAWQIDNNVFHSEHTLRPDFLKNYRFADSNYLLIFDAKYYAFDYDIEHTNLIKSAPGVGDITKQYMYQKALEQYVTINEIHNVYNAFLLPSNEEYIQVKGNVRFDFISNLQAIKLVYLNAKDLFFNYINNEHWSTNYLDNLLTELQSN